MCEDEDEFVNLGDGRMKHLQSAFIWLMRYEVGYQFRMWGIYNVQEG